MPTLLKPGLQTTELWVTVAADVGLLIAALADALPPRYAAIAVAVSNAAYAVSRGLAKLNPPKDAPAPPTTGTAA